MVVDHLNEGKINVFLYYVVGETAGIGILSLIIPPCPWQRNIIEFIMSQ